MLTDAPFATVFTAVAAVFGARRTLSGSPAVWTVPVAAAAAGAAVARANAPAEARTTPEPAQRRSFERFMATE
jgi:hypothetical protein